MIIVDPLLIIVLWLIRAYIWVIIIGVILSWLINFQVVNSYNRFVFLVQDLTNRLTEPALGPIRRFLPTLGGIDISPIILILGLWFLEMVIDALGRCRPLGPWSRPLPRPSGRYPKVCGSPFSSSPGPGAKLSAVRSSWLTVRS